MSEIKKKTNILANGLIQIQDKFLFLKRNSKEVDGSREWEIPGGRVEFGEDPSEAVLREVKEETSLDTEIVSIYRILSKEYEKQGKKVHLLRIIYILKTHEKPENVKLSKEHEDYKWLRKQEIRDLNLSNYLKEIL